MSSAPDPPAFVFPTVGPELFEALRSAHPARIVLQGPVGGARKRRPVGGPPPHGNRRGRAARHAACFGACTFPIDGSGPGLTCRDGARARPDPQRSVARLPTSWKCASDGGDPAVLAEICPRHESCPHRLGLVASVQHLDLVSRLDDALKERGYEVS